MITHIFNDRVYHCDINNTNCMHAPPDGKDWRFIKIVSEDYVDLSQEEIDEILERERAEEALRAYINTGENWSIGEDLNDSSKFKISNSETVGVNDCITIDGTIKMTAARGFLPPRLTTVERDAITDPEPGLTIYNTTVNLLNFYNGITWRAV